MVQSILTSHWLCEHLVSPFFFFFFSFCLSGNSLQFKVGTVYQYSYSTSTLFNEVNTEESKATATQKDVGVQLSIEFDVIPLLTSPDMHFLKLQVLSMSVTVWGHTCYRNRLYGRIWKSKISLVMSSLHGGKQWNSDCLKYSEVK